MSLMRRSYRKAVSIISGRLSDHYKRAEAEDRFRREKQCSQPRFQPDDERDERNAGSLHDRRPDSDVVGLPAGIL